MDIEEERNLRAFQAGRAGRSNPSGLSSYAAYNRGRLLKQSDDALLQIASPLVRTLLVLGMAVTVVGWVLAIAVTAAAALLPMLVPALVGSRYLSRRARTSYWKALWSIAAGSLAAAALALAAFGAQPLVSPSGEWTPYLALPPLMIALQAWVTRLVIHRRVTFCYAILMSGCVMLSGALVAFAGLLLHLA